MPSMQISAGPAKRNAAYSAMFGGEDEVTELSFTHEFTALIGMLVK